MATLQLKKELKHKIIFYCKIQMYHLNIMNAICWQIINNNELKNF